MYVSPQRPQRGTCHYVWLCTAVTCAVQVAKPAAVSRAEASPGDLGEEQVLEAITAFQLAVGQYSALARSLLPAYTGYECKEPEPGKFTMAFG